MGKAKLQDAICAIEQHNYTKALNLLKQSVNSAESRGASLYYLGYLYELGLGTIDKAPKKEHALVCYYNAYSCGLENAGKPFARIYEKFSNKNNYLKHKYPASNFADAYNQICG